MKHITIAGIAASALLATSFSALAAQDDPPETRFYVAPMFSYKIPHSNTHPLPGAYGDGGFEAHSENGWQLNLGKNLGDYLALELYAFTYDDINISTPAGYAGADKLETTGYGVSALFFPARDILPIYAVVGGGYDNYSLNESARDDFHYKHGMHYDLGAGFMLPLNDYGIALRTEYRYRSASIERSEGSREHFRDDIISVGLQIPLGAPATTPEPEPMPVTPEPEPQVEKKAPVILHGVTFEFDSAQLTAQAEHRLDNVHDALVASPEVDFRIEGYTDSIGAAAYNQKLSEERAHSVSDYLTSHGIASTRITDVIGYGEENPVAPNTNPDGTDNPEGRAKNRRVELHVVNQ